MPPKTAKAQQADRLEELIEKLNDRLSVLCEPELKRVCLKQLVEIHKSLNLLTDQFTQLYETLGADYQDINYPDVSSN